MLNQQGVLSNFREVASLEAVHQWAQIGTDTTEPTPTMPASHQEDVLLAKTVFVTPTPIPTSDSTTVANMVPEIDYNYTFLRHHVDYKTKYPLPDWMEEFLSKQPTGDSQKHHEMLADLSNQFLVMTCYKYRGGVEECGGFTDRLMNLAWNMWAAHQTNRKLLIKYYKPRPLEEFLVPPPPSDHGFNWMMPDGYFPEEWSAWGNRSSHEYKNNRRWDPTIQALNMPAFREKRVIFVNNNLLGKKPINRLEGWDENLWQGVFLRFFQPSREVARRLDLITDPLQLEAGTYSSAHVRAKFPTRTLNQKYGYLKFVGQKWYQADKSPDSRLDLTDNMTQRVVSELGNHAVACAVRVMPDTKYVYMASDVKELIEYLTTDSPYWADSDTKKVTPTISWEAFDYEAAISNQTDQTEVISSEIHGWGVSSWEVPTHATVIMRHDYKDPSAHFDGNRYPKSEPSLFGAVVDHWMLAHAGGHSIGVGGFGRFGSVLAGNNLTTRVRHRDYSDVSPSCATSAERKVWKKFIQDNRKHGER